MRRGLFRLAALLLVSLASGRAQLPFVAEPAFVPLSFDEPLAIVTPPGDSERIFVVEKRGRIRVFSEYGKGTRVEVRLPLEANPDRILPPLLSEGKPVQPHWRT